MIGHQDLKRKEFPKKEAFNSSLGIGRTISDDDYQHGMRVWEKFGCSSFLDYSHIYVFMSINNPMISFTDSINKKVITD